MESRKGTRQRRNRAKAGRRVYNKRTEEIHDLVDIFSSALFAPENGKI